MVTIHLPRTIAAVRDALPEGEREEFLAVMESTEVAELPLAFERWFHRAAINLIPGLRERIDLGLGSGTGDGKPFDEVFPGARERWLASRGLAA